MNLQDDENSIINKEFQKSVEEKRIHNLEKVFKRKTNQSISRSKTILTIL